MTPFARRMLGGAASALAVCAVLLMADAVRDQSPAPTAFPASFPTGVTASDVSDELDALQRRMLAHLVEQAADGTPVPEICFAPGTPAHVIGAFYAAAMSSSRQLESFRLSTRWSTTASSGGGLQQGDPTTITWGIVPDGTSIAGFAGEPSAGSDLKAKFNTIYGSQATWQALIQQVFDRWGALTGARYVFESNDDGVALGTASGSLGTRADVRIGGHFIDGNSGVLAYNFFPNNGDMVLDSSDSFFSNTSGNSIRLRNVVSHEHGHGLGIAHVCPVNQTKLMEPFATTVFDGPQHDDILTGNRGYGDPNEHNDSAGAATNLGTLSNGTTSVTGVSIDDNADVDYYRFSVGDTARQVTVTLQPQGSTYLEGLQFGTGACSAGSSFDSLTLNDVGVALIGTNGSTVLVSANSGGAGSLETFGPFALSSATGPYYVRVFGGSNDTAQLYRVSLTIADIGAGAPGPVTNLMAAVTNFDVTFTWNAATGASSYRIEAGSAPGLADLTTVALGKALSFAATGPAGSYFVAVRGVSGAVVGPRSNEVNVVLPGGGCTPAPNPPSGLNFTVAGSTVTLNWVGSTGCPPTTYIIEAGSAPGLSDRGRFDTKSTATSIAVPGVPSGTYFVRVIGQNAFGASGPSNEVQVVVP